MLSRATAWRSQGPRVAHSVIQVMLPKLAISSSVGASKSNSLASCLSRFSLRWDRKAFKSLRQFDCGRRAASSPAAVLSEAEAPYLKFILVVIRSKLLISRDMKI